MSCKSTLTLFCFFLTIFSAQAQEQNAPPDELIIAFELKPTQDLKQACFPLMQLQGVQIQGVSRQFNMVLLKLNLNATSKNAVLDRLKNEGYQFMIKQGSIDQVLNEYPSLFMIGNNIQPEERR